MEEIKVEEYVRTDFGKIYKFSIEKIQEINELPPFLKRITFSSIVKHSPNIIDLIELGDIVTVEEIDTEWERTVEVDEEEYIKYLKMYVGKEEKLKKIVTKEQFENISYKVEG